jgi:signal peptidase I
MNKLKMLVLAALVAATVGVGALVATPSASAQPTLHSALCAEIGHELLVANHWEDVFSQLLGPDSFWARYWNQRSNTMGQEWKLMSC